MKVRMTRRYCVIILLLTILPFCSFAASPPLIEIRTEYVVQNARFFGNINQIFFEDNRIFVGRTVIDMDDYSIKVMDEKEELYSVMGEQDNKLIVSRESSEKYIKDIFFYDPSNDSYLVFDLLPSDRSGTISYLNHFFLSQYFVTNDDGGGGGSTKLINFANNEVTQIGRYVSDVSPDKQHFIMVGSTISVLNLHLMKGVPLSNHQLSEIEYRMQYPIAHFINNELVMFRRSLQHNIYSIFNISGKEVLRFQYVHPDNRHSSFFSKIRDSEYGFFSSSEIVRAIGEREALEDFGLLFRSTTGTANDSRVRIREYALLEATNLGYLSKGDKLEILDRSGIKVKIGDMEDYWYKIRRASDGIEGWSYGAFIDVDEVPPLEDDGSPKSYRILDEDPSEYVHPRDR